MGRELGLAFRIDVNPSDLAEEGDRIFKRLLKKSNLDGILKSETKNTLYTMILKAQNSHRRYLLAFFNGLLTCDK